MKHDKEDLAEDPGCVETYVTLRILGDNLDPKSVTSRSEITPTKAYSKGEKYPSKSGKMLVHPTGNWTLATQASVTSTNVEKHALALLRELAGKETAFRDLKADAKLSISITIWWRPKDGHGCFGLTARTMATLCEYANDVVTNIS